ncbi:hypothetical protein BGZ94_006640, partial [Podila epigama]
MASPPSFRQGSIFFDKLTPEALLNPAHHHQPSDTILGVSNVLESAKASLASPPPSPSRNTIFHQSWSATAGPY